MFDEPYDADDLDGLPVSSVFFIESEWTSADLAAATKKKGGRRGAKKGKKAKKGALKGPRAVCPLGLSLSADERPFIEVRF